LLNFLGPHLSCDALLIADLQMQVMSAILWVVLFFSLHLACWPYESLGLNVLELVALAATAVTAILSVALSYNSDNSVVSAAVPTSSELTQRQLAVTVLLSLMNGLVMAGLAGYWLWQQSWVRLFERISTVFNKVQASLSSLSNRASLATSDFHRGSTTVGARLSNSGPQMGISTSNGGSCTIEAFGNQPMMTVNPLNSAARTPGDGPGSHR
jgi:hypothetical protein